MRPFAPRPADCISRLRNVHSNSADQTRRKSHFNFAKQGNQSRAQDNREDHCTPGKVPNGVRWKNLCAANRVRRLPEKFVVSWSWRRDSNPRPSDYKSDALPTELRQQFWGTSRLRANESLGSLPDVRDNYIKYHSVKLGCNREPDESGLTMLSFLS